MKLTKNSAEILIIEDPKYPKGLYAFVDFDYDPDGPPQEYRKLKWVCEDEEWQALLNATLLLINPGSLDHYPLDHPNPPRHAALVAEEAFGIKILSEGITRRTGVIIDEDDD